MGGLAQDLRYGVRQFRKNPGFTAVAVLTLALGIGASAAVFSIFDAVLLRPLSYRDASRLVSIWSSELHQPGTKIFAPFRDFQEFKTQSRSFETLAALTWARAGEILTWHGSAHQVVAIPASEDFFPLLGVPAETGRTFGHKIFNMDARSCSPILFGKPSWVRRRILLAARWSLAIGAAQSSASCQGDSSSTQSKQLCGR